MIFRKGDIVVNERGVERLIVDVGADYYLWEYPDLKQEFPFDSRNSSDPQFELGWKIKS